MGNFPIKEIQEEWLVELIRDTYPPTPLYYEELINCEFNYNGTVQLIPSHLYKWDKGTVPPIAEGVKWLAFGKDIMSIFSIQEGLIRHPEYWKDGTLCYFMILGD